MSSENVKIEESHAIVDNHKKIEQLKQNTLHKANSKFDFIDNNRSKTSTAKRMG